MLLDPLLHFGIGFFAWLVGMGVYLLAQPYPEIRSVREGNGGAAISFAGMALGLALPLSVLPPVTESLMQIASVAILVLIIQLWVWVFVAYVLFPGLRKGVPAQRTSASIALAGVVVSTGLLSARALAT